MNFMEELVLEAIYRQAKKLLDTDEEHSDGMKTACLNALNSIRKQVRDYASQGFIFCLLLGFMRKKSHMILMAETKAELVEMLTPSVPRWNYGTFITGPYHVLEEEMILWSAVSLVIPLNEDGAKRYEAVFSALFPEMAAEIFKK